MWIEKGKKYFVPSGTKYLFCGSTHIMIPDRTSFNPARLQSGRVSWTNSGQKHFIALISLFKPAFKRFIRGVVESDREIIQFQP